MMQTEDLAREKTLLEEIVARAYIILPIHFKTNIRETADPHLEAKLMSKNFITSIRAMFK